MSTRSSLMERLGPQVRAQVADRSRSGSRVRLALRAQPTFERTVAAARALARCGVSFSVARRAVDTLSARRPTSVMAPDFDAALIVELDGLGVSATPLNPLRRAVVKAVRAELAMSQDQFANAFALELKTVQAWERGQGEFDPALSVLFRLIAAHPQLVEAVAAHEGAAAVPSSESAL